MKPIDIVIVEDDLYISNLLRQFLSSKAEFNILDFFSSVEDLVNASTTIQKPDVVIMDIMLPGMNGIQGVSEVLRIWPETKIIMNSVLKDSEGIYESLRAGAVGYISKDMQLDAVKDAVISVHSGGSYMNPQIARKVVAYFQKSLLIKEVLNEKEWNIAMGIKNGLSYKLVAEENNMTIDGVRFYIQRIYRKLNINSKSQLSKIIG